MKDGIARPRQGATLLKDEPERVHSQRFASLAALLASEGRAKAALLLVSLMVLRVMTLNRSVVAEVLRSETYDLSHGVTCVYRRNTLAQSASCELLNVFCD